MKDIPENSESKNTHTEGKVLIANRGEIAVRIIRACRDLGLRSIAVYAEPDRDALHVKVADEAYSLQGKTASETYLDISKILQIAKTAGATMIHPGYGFLSERADFARAVQEAGITWVGPKPEAIELLGDKLRARELALEVGAPLARGTENPIESVDELYEFAEQYGFPIAIKAAYGGGGRGIKVVRRKDEIEEMFNSAQREAVAAFGRGECFIEQFLTNPRHIEVQVLGDHQGNLIVVGTRDCSLQRRNQKLVEEAPAPFLSNETRQQIHRAAIDICKAAEYTSAGTVEFLLSEEGQLSFLEVNTRLQVEHPVTEETSGLDLVIEQLRVAQGQPLSQLETPEPKGHSLEFRINAEDAANGFLPTSGKINSLDVPGGIGVRIDSGIEAGSVVGAGFDSMMAKLIVTGKDRAQAISRARRALDEFRIEGVASTLPFHCAVLQETDFAKDFKVHTRWIEEVFTQPIEPGERSLPEPDPGLKYFYIELDGKRHRIGMPVKFLNAAATSSDTVQAQPQFEDSSSDPAAVTATVSGTLIKWLVTDGSEVEEGQQIAVMEAMKMEIHVSAHRSGTLKHAIESDKFVEVGEKIADIS